MKSAVARKTIQVLKAEESVLQKRKFILDADLKKARAEYGETTANFQKIERTIIEQLSEIDTELAILNTVLKEAESLSGE